MNFILVLGASSDIAQPLMRLYAKAGYGIVLAGRFTNRLSAAADELRRQYGIETHVCYFDLTDLASHQKMYASLSVRPAGVICCAGYLGDQIKGQGEFSEAEKIILTNYTGWVSILNCIANDFEDRRSGFIVGISSVAGERGRKFNYLYGSAKAGFSAYLSGLRHRLETSNVQVLTVKPGYVHTKMIHGMKTPGFLTAAPETVAHEIFRAQQRGKDILYATPIWRWIMIVWRMLPEKVFKKLNLQ